MPRDFGKEARAGRARELSVLAILVLLILLAKLVSLQLVRGAEMRKDSQENRTRVDVLRGERGRILDRNGEILADNYPSHRLTFDSRDLQFRDRPDRVQATLGEIGGALDRDPGELSRLVVRARKRSPRPAVLSRTLTFAQVSELEERLDRLAGLQVEVVSVRRYPGGELACHLLGHLGEVSESELTPDGVYKAGDQVGRMGIERQYEPILRGGHGEAYVQVDALGRRTDYFPELSSQPAEPGHDIRLTIDAHLQAAAEAALEAIPLPPGAGGEEGGHPAGAIVAIDPRNGEVLALASRPAFDPNRFVGGLTPEEWDALAAPSRPLLNRATQSTYPPGSTFKAVIALAGLEAGVVRQGQKFLPCTGSYWCGDRAFRCWKRGGHGRLDLLEALTQSCDIFFYQIGQALQIEGIGRYGERFRVGEATGIDLPEERAGLVPTPEWYRERYGPGGIGAGAALNLAIGQGEVLLSPIELARFYATIGNGGRLVRPHLLLEVLGPDGEILRDTRQENWEVGRLPVKDENLALVQEGLERVVMHERGTGKRARVGEIRIAGKTGTAENPHGQDHALFACYAPAEDPRIAIAVIAEQSGHGGVAAAPAAQRVLEAFFFGTAPETAEVSEDESSFVWIDE